MSEARAAGITLYARSVYLQGLIFCASRGDSEPLRQGQPYVRAVEKLAAETGLSIREFAYYFVKTEKRIDDILVGCDRADQVRENAELDGRSIQIGERIRAELRSCVEDVPDLVIDPRKW